MVVVQSSIPWLHQISEIDDDPILPVQVNMNLIYS
jgi:hypothetical protein